MTKFSNGSVKIAKIDTTRWISESKEELRPPEKTFDDENDDLRLRRSLKRTIEKDRAPQRLIDAIRDAIKG